MKIVFIITILMIKTIIIVLKVHPVILDILNQMIIQKNVLNMTLKAILKSLY